MFILNTMEQQLNGNMDIGKVRIIFKENHDCILSWSDNNEILKELRTYATFKTPIITRFVNQKNDTDFKLCTI